MVEVVGIHYYIYKPTQLVDLSAVIPCFLGREDLVVKAKFLPLITSEQRGTDQCALKMLGKPGFDSQSFRMVPVAEFFSPYLDIITSNGVSWPSYWRLLCGMTVGIFGYLLLRLPSFDLFLCLDRGKQVRP